MAAGAAVALVALGVGRAEARPSAIRPDRSFGQEGRVMLRASHERVAAIAPDGGMILSRRWSLRRLTPEGKLDSSFGEAGVVTPPPVSGGQFEISDVAVDGSGRLVVAGTSTPPQPPPTQPAPGSEPHFESLSETVVTSARILRYLPSGTLDPAFGDQGIVETDFGLPAPTSEGEQLAPKPLVEVAGVAVDDAGHIVISGGAGAGARGGCAHDWFWDTLTYAAFVARLTESGAADTSFGGGDGVFGGHAASENPLLAEVAAAPVVSPDQGVTFLRGYGKCPRAAGRPDAAQLSPSGEPVAPGEPPSYPGWIAAAAPAPDGSVALLELPNHGRPSLPGVVRVEPDGALRGSFGRSGRTALHLPGGDESYVDAIAVDSRNRVLLAGVRETQPARQPKGASRAKPRRSCLLVRLNPQGGVDKTLGTRGAVTIPLPHLTGGCALRLDRQGRAILSATYRRDKHRHGLTIARYVFGP